MLLLNTKKNTEISFFNPKYLKFAVNNNVPYVGFFHQYFLKVENTIYLIFSWISKRNILFFDNAQLQIYIQNALFTKNLLLESLNTFTVYVYISFLYNIKNSAKLQNTFNETIVLKTTSIENKKRGLKYLCRRQIILVNSFFCYFY